MYTVDPTTIAKLDKGRLMDGFLQNRLAILQHALEHARAFVSDETIRNAAEYVSESSGVPITAAEFAKLLQLYPYAVAKFADYGWGDTEISEMALDVVAHALLGTRWPIGMDSGCNMEGFVKNLRLAYSEAKPLLSDGA